MKQSPDNQVNASFIDNSRIKWLVFFLLRSSFFRTTAPLASSEATAYYRPVPCRTEIKDLVTMDINPSLQILGWYVKGTGLG